MYKGSLALVGMDLKLGFYSGRGTSLGGKHVWRVVLGVEVHDRGKIEPILDSYMLWTFYDNLGPFAEF